MPTGGAGFEETPPEESGELTEPGLDVELNEEGGLGGDGHTTGDVVYERY